MYAQVLIEYSAKSIDRTFTYIIPENLKNDIKIGMKVLVPFNNKIINGFVTGITDSYEEDYELKEIQDIVDKYLVLNDELLQLGNTYKNKLYVLK